MAGTKVFELLRQHWQTRQKKDRKFSLRYLARKADLSPAYLSKIFSGQKPLPLARLRALASALDLDPVAIRALERTTIREHAGVEEFSENLELEMDGGAAASPLPDLPSADYQSASSQTALEEWYFLPILDLATCAGFEPAWIHERLGLKPEVADRAWARLQELGWVESKNGKWRKVTTKIRFPSSRIDPRIQRHHTKMLQKAADELAYKKTDDDFRRRLILGASVATNETSYRKAEKYLEEALFKTADILSTGKADRVYYLAFQLFPLTRKGLPGKTQQFPRMHRVPRRRGT
jgi:uncharacterized protein (TIGR02147 family)